MTNTSTRVDDMLIEMISPKVKEIEEKFVNNQALSQDDINTLLLKSQYNHINHLDIKLDEVTAVVASLKNDFTGLKNDFTGLKNEFFLFKTEIKAEMNANKTEIKAEMNANKAEINAKFDLLDERVAHTIQKALNKNMLTLIVVMGAFLTLSKVIDKF